VRFAVVCITLLTACGDESVQRGPDALSTALEPSRPASYYIDQAERYFDTLDTSADRNSKPSYSVLVARWEWPPWLKLTGIGREQIEELDAGVLVVTPSTVPERDCRVFQRQPFARCYVSFDYPQKGRCPIYEEFTFNDDGEVTFIEAWSNLPGMLPSTDASDRWAEGAGVQRLSTKVPGLGNSEGLIDLDAKWMEDAAQQDADVADFLKRARDFASWWLKEYNKAGSDLFARGCGWK
jgi:hypothetical protein